MFPVVAANKERVRNFNGPRPNIVAIFVGAAPALAGMAMLIVTQNPLWFISGIILGLILMQSPKVAKQWEKAVVLRLGRFMQHVLWEPEHDGAETDVPLPSSSRSEFDELVTEGLVTLEAVRVVRYVSPDTSRSTNPARRR